jgi:UDPglucose 6-dehydrogenase
MATKEPSASRLPGCVLTLEGFAMNSRRIAVIGTGYVGLTAGACLASLGHDVVCVDIDSTRVAQLNSATVALLEPGLSELVGESVAEGRLRFTTDVRSPFTTGERAPADVIFLCVPTPMAADGSADLSAVTHVLELVRDLLPPGCVVVTKSTVPVGTADLTLGLIGRDDVFVVSNPEFLREGSAVQDFLRPDRIVAGSHSREAAQRVLDLYEGLGAVTQVTDPASAELIKYASNCFLAMKLSYVNVLAERFGADVGEVVAGMGNDRRIGRWFLDPGPGWGGSCFPKDTSALLAMARSAGTDFALLKASLDTNRQVHARIVDKVRAAAGGSLHDVRIGLLGVTFKAGTDDVRDSPALAVAELLYAEGAILTAYDPTCPNLGAGFVDKLTVTDTPFIAAKDAAVLVVLTEWPEFRALDWTKLAELVESPKIIDTRNALDPLVVRAAGFSWVGNGRQ